MHVLPGSRLLVTPVFPVSDFGVLWSSFTGTQTLLLPKDYFKDLSSNYDISYKGDLDHKKYFRLILSVHFEKSNEVLSYHLPLGCFTIMLCCFPLHKPGPKWRHLVPLPVSSEEWDEDEERLFWSKGCSLTANMRDRFLKVHSLKRHNGEEFILLQVEQPFEKCFTIQTY